MIAKLPRYVKGLLAGCGLLLLTQGTQAQTSIGFSVSAAEPKGVFSRNLGGRYIGSLGLDIGYKIPKVPLRVGGEISYGIYYTQTALQPYTHKNYSHTEADITVSNNVVNYGLSVRLEPWQNTRILPYLEAKTGNSYFFTDWSASDPYENNNSSCPGYIESKTVYKKTTAYSGFGGGMRFDMRIFNGCKVSGCNYKDKTRFMIDIGAHYIAGGQTSYMVSDSWNAPSALVFDPNEASTDPHAPHYGTNTSSPARGSAHEFGTIHHSVTNRMVYKVGVVVEFR